MSSYLMRFSVVTGYLLPPVPPKDTGYEDCLSFENLRRSTWSGIIFSVIKMSGLMLATSDFSRCVRLSVDHKGSA